MTSERLNLFLAGLGLATLGWALLANREEIARLEARLWTLLGIRLTRPEELSRETNRAAGLLSLVVAPVLLIAAFLG